jgi:hypothetical protein
MEAEYEINGGGLDRFFIPGQAPCDKRSLLFLARRKSLPGIQRTELHVRFSGKSRQYTSFIFRIQDGAEYNSKLCLKKSFKTDYR